jgi:polysaccharide pyruvyl transferase WcaK-like protein
MILPEERGPERGQQLPCERLASALPRKNDGLRIGLLTPYTGGNLGDGAIQDAVIENLKVIFPDATFCLFTLDPQTTTELHRVPSLPLAGHIISCYWDSSGPEHGNGASPNRNGESPRGRSRAITSLWSGLKKHPLLRRLLLPPWLLARRVMTMPVHFVREVCHVVAMRSVVSELNLLIVSGGGQIDDYWGGPMGHPYAMLKWGLLAKALGVKFVFLSVGVGSLDSWLSSFFAKRALQLADYRSYRDSGSKRLLAGIEFTRPDPIIPDLAFSYRSRSAIAQSSSPGGKTALKIGVSPIVYLHQNYWPKADETIFGRYIETLTSFISLLLRNGHVVVLFESDAPDREATKVLKSNLERESPNRIPTNLRVARVNRVAELFAELADLDCVVASRLHGVILSHLCIKPVLAISYERKVRQHMRDMEQEAYCLDIHDIHAGELGKSFDSLISRQDDLRAVIKRKVKSYRKHLSAQYDGVSRMVQR